MASAWHIITLLFAQVFLRRRTFLVVAALILASMLTTPTWAPIETDQVWTGVSLVACCAILLHIVQRHRDGIEYARLVELADVNDQLFRESKAREEALAIAKAASETKTRFLANMSHELRTPLNAVIGYVEYVIECQEDDATLSEDEVEALRRSVDSSVHLVELIGDILDLTKIEAGRFEIRHEEIDIADFTRALAQLIEPLSHRRHNRFIVESSAGGSLFSDATRLRQILVNLLGNACKFTDRGEITLTVRDLERDGAPWVEFRVEDTGIGIAPAQLESVFDPFTQVDDSPTKSHQGTGLGLAVTRRLLDLLSGTIAVTSVLGEGSVFTVAVPREPPSKSSKSMRTLPPSGGA